MSKTAFFVLFSLFSAWVGSPAAHSIEIPRSVYESVVRLQVQNGCGSGVVLPNGLILTNAHVARPLCPQGNCHGLKVLRSKQPGDEPEGLDVQELQVVQEIPSLDLAFLRSKTALPTAGISVRDEALRGSDPVFVLGFPGCGKLEESRGQVTRFDPIHVSVSARSFAGGSGGPILDEGFRLIGVVNEVEGGIINWLAIFTHKLFWRLRWRAPLEGVLLHRWEELSSENTEISLLAEFRRINQFSEEFLDRIPLRQRYRHSVPIQSIISRALMRGVGSDVCPELLPLYVGSALRQDEVDWIRTLTIRASSSRCEQIDYELRKLMILNGIEAGAVFKRMLQGTEGSQNRGGPVIRVDQFSTMLDHAEQKEYFGQSIVFLAFCLCVGAATFLSGVLGTLAFQRRRRVRWWARLPLIGLAVALPFIVSYFAFGAAFGFE